MKAELRAAGGSWDAKLKGWIFETEKQLAEAWRAELGGGGGGGVGNGMVSIWVAVFFL